MNKFVKFALVEAVQFFIAQEPLLEAHLADDRAKTVARAAVAAAKELVPLLQSL